MKTKEEKLIEAIGDTSDKNILLAVGHDAADPETKADVHYVEFREAPKPPENVIRRYRIRNGIIGGIAAALVIAGGVGLWAMLRDNPIETAAGEATGTSAVGGSEQSVTDSTSSVTDSTPAEAEDPLLYISDPSMPEPFAPADTTLYGGELHDEFYAVWKKDFHMIDGRITALAGERGEELLAKYAEEEAADNEAGNITRYRIDDTRNQYRFITDAGLSAYDVRRALIDPTGRGGMVEPDIYVTLSSKKETAMKEKSEYCIAVDEFVFSPRWLYYHTPADYEKAGITVIQIKMMLPIYEKLGFTDEAWATFKAKLNGFIDEHKTLSDDRSYVVYLPGNGQTTNDNAISIIENVFYGEWRRVPATGSGSLDTVKFTYTESPYTISCFHRPLHIAETDDIYYIESINGGVGEYYVVEKSDPKTLYRTEPKYHDDDWAAYVVCLDDEWSAKYEYVETRQTKTVEVGKISCLGELWLFNRYGYDLEQFFNDSLNGGFMTDDGKSYILDGDITTAEAQRYLVDMDDDHVTLGIRFFEEQEYIKYFQERDYDSPPTEYYFAITFRKSENGWTFGYGPLDGIDTDIPVKVYSSSPLGRYYTEATLKNVRLSGDSIHWSSATLTIKDTMDSTREPAKAELTTGLAAQDSGYDSGSDIRMFNYGLGDGEAIATVWFPINNGFLVSVYHYDGNKLQKLCYGRNGGEFEPFINAIDSIDVGDDGILYVTDANDGGIVTGYTVDESGSFVTEVYRSDPAEETME